MEAARPEAFARLSSHGVKKALFESHQSIAERGGIMNNSTVYEPILIPDYIAYTSLFLCSIVLAVGLLGNMMVIIVILTSKVLRSSTNLFLLNLSVADMLVLAICTPSTLVDVATRRADVWVMGKVCLSLKFRSDL